MSTVLIIDDNEGVCTALEVLFSLRDIDAISAHSPAEGLQRLREDAIDLVVQDMNFSGDTTSGLEGVELFNAIRAERPDMPVILLTAWTHLEQAVELVRAGAADYLAKPWDDDKLLTTASNLLDLAEARQTARQVNDERQSRRDELAERFNLCGLIYASEAMHDVVSLATRVAKADVPVLITGENGAGKELIAKIVQANSDVSDGPFITVNAGALPSELIEAELFGAEAGAYTGATKAREGRFESADGGTLFLDEIGNLPAGGQMKFLRVLQSGEFERLGSSKTRQVNVRVISATNANLTAAIDEGGFREDLYYRINVIELKVPPLRERRDDILPLAEHFLDDQHSLSKSAQRALLRYDWPGNVRELENRIQRACLLAAKPSLQPEDIDLPQAPAQKGDEASKEDVQQALADNNGVIAKAADQLGMSRQALYRRMEKFGISKAS